MRHPLRENRSAATHDASDAFRDHWQILNQDSSVDRHVVDALCSLFFDNFEIDFRSEVFDSLHAANGFINRNRADGNRRVTQNSLANLGNISACTEVHYGIGTEMNCGV